MRYLSTRDHAQSYSLSEAIDQGLTLDGGLFMPDRLPVFEPLKLAENLTLAETAAEVLQPFFQEDPFLGHELASICKSALNFPVPLKQLSNNTAVMELFHGPTAAFKDVGARFLAECFARMPAPQDANRRTVLVATSGDTGGAVAAAFHGKPGIEVAILFPLNGVSPLQKRQLTCWGGNVRSFAIRGIFDDCQNLVKAAFVERATHPAWARHALTSANSINIGRLLPQLVYYVTTSLEYWRRTGMSPGYVIPSGNLGNAMAAVLAKKMGFPIREILLATNANRVVPDYFSSGIFSPAPSRKTLANAMDVGNPSNLERLTHLIPDLDQLRAFTTAVSVTDEQIRETLRKGPDRYGEIWCPHTAAAVFAREQRHTGHWIIAATAHPAKFNDIIEPLIGRSAPLPGPLRQLMNRPEQVETLDAKLEVLRSALCGPS